MITKEYVDKQFEQLKDPNFDINKLDLTGRSLLFLACKICDFDKIKLLVSLGCDINIVDNIGHNCITTICSLPKFENKFKILKFFIEVCKVDPYHTTNKNESCLYFACKMNDIDIAEYLLNNYSDLIDVVTYNDVSCIEIAIINGHYEIFKLLLKKGVDVNLFNEETGLSCLMTACISKRFEIVKDLIEAGAELDLINFKNKNALYYAAYHAHNNDEIILYLLENGAFICDRTRKLLSRVTNEKILKYLDK
jgi:hypothetical protein